MNLALQAHCAYELYQTARSLGHNTLLMDGMTMLLFSVPGIRLAPEELYGERWLEFIHPDDAPVISAALSEGRESVSFRYRAPPGRWFEVSACIRGDGCHKVCVLAYQPTQEPIEKHE